MTFQQRNNEMELKLKLNPAKTGAAYKALLPDWSLCETLLGGTRAMREAGLAYLPKHENESDTAWNCRLSGSVLAPFFKAAIDGVAGRIFARPVALSDDASDAFKVLAANVDRLGENIDGFARRHLEAALTHGVAYA